MKTDTVHTSVPVIELFLFSVLFIIVGIKCWALLRSYVGKLLKWRDRWVKFLILFLYYNTIFPRPSQWFDWSAFNMFDLYLHKYKCNIFVLCCSILLNPYRRKTETPLVEQWYSQPQRFFSHLHWCFMLPVFRGLTSCPWGLEFVWHIVVTLSRLHNKRNKIIQRNTQAAYLRTNVQRRWLKPH